MGVGTKDGFVFDLVFGERKLFCVEMGRFEGGVGLGGGEIRLGVSFRTC